VAGGSNRAWGAALTLRRKACLRRLSWGDQLAESRWMLSVSDGRILVPPPSGRQNPDCRILLPESEYVPQTAPASADAGGT